MKQFNLNIEIRLAGGLTLWDTDNIKLKATDLEGAIAEGSKTLTRLKKGYGKDFVIRVFLKEITGGMVA